MDDTVIIFVFLCSFVLFEFITESKAEDDNDFLTLAYSKGFVDKTLLIKRFFESPIEKIFVTAPKGFGKSINMDMIKTFAEMRINQIGFDASDMIAEPKGKFREKPIEELSERFKVFKNNSLDIYMKHRKFFYKNFGKYPLVYLNLKNIRIHSYKNFLQDMALLVVSCFKRYEHLQTSNFLKKVMKRRMKRYLLKMEGVRWTINFNIKRALRFLCKVIYESFGSKVLLLIDGIDTPIMKGINQKDFFFFKVWRFIQMFTWNIVGSTFVGRVLINSRAELFSVSPEHRRERFRHVPFLRNEIFSEFYGFTDADIDALSHKFDSNNNSLSNIRSRYGGYKVVKTGTELYNTQSVSDYYKTLGNNSTNSWFDEVQMKNMKKLFLQKEMRSRIETMLEGHPLQIRLRDGCVNLPYSELALLQEVIAHYNLTMEPYEAELIMQYLLQFGYFNIIGRKLVNNSINITIPNTEIGEYFARLVYSVDYYMDKFNITCEDIDLYIGKILKLRGNDRKTFVEFANSVETLFKSQKSPRHVLDVYRSLLVFALDSKKFKVVDGKFYRDNNRSCNNFSITRNDGVEMIVVVKFQVGSAHSGLEEALNQGLKPMSLGTEQMIVCLHLDNVKKCTIAYLHNSLDIRNLIHVSSIK